MRFKWLDRHRKKHVVEIVEEKQYVPVCWVLQFNKAAIQFESLIADHNDALWNAKDDTEDWGQRQASLSASKSANARE